MASNTKKWMATFLSIVGVVNLTGCSEPEKSAAQIKDTVIIAEKKVEAANISEYSLEQDGSLNKEIDINLNQVGYRPTDKKLAVIRNNAGKSEYQVLDEEGNIAYTGVLSGGITDGFYNETLYYADFSELSEEGTYYIMCGDSVASPFFEIKSDIYTEINKLAIAPFSIELYFASNVSQEQKEDVLEEYSSFEKRSKEARQFSTGETVDVSGGWYTTADSGRYVVTSCTALMELMYVKQYYKKAIDQLDEKYDDIDIDLDESIKKELSWLLKTQDEKTGGVYHKVTTASSDSAEMSPDDGIIYLSNMSTCATADFCAVMAKGYRLYKNKDRSFAIECLEAGKNAWTYLETHSENIQFINPVGLNTKEYSDDNDKDERLLAATELYLATKEDSYYQYMKEKMEYVSKLDFGWKNVSGFAYFDYVSDSSADNEIYQQMASMLQNEADEIVLGSDQGYQINQNISEGNTEYLMNRIILLALMDKESGNNNYKTQRQNYINYLLGQNPKSKNYMETLTKKHEELSLELSSAWLLITSSI